MQTVALQFLSLAIKYFIHISVFSCHSFYFWGPQQEVTSWILTLWYCVEQSLLVLSMNFARVPFVSNRSWQVLREHIQAYIVKPTSPSNKTIIVIEDIFGGNTPTPENGWSSGCQQIHVRRGNSKVYSVKYCTSLSLTILSPLKKVINLQSVLHGSVYWQIYCWWQAY